MISANEMKKSLEELCRNLGADLVGFAPIDRFPADSTVRRILPETRTVIGLGFRVLRGAYRGVEEGSTYYQYTTMGVENMEETVMPMAQLRLSMYLEEMGYLALPQRRHQQIMAEHDSTNPEVAFDAIWREKEGELQMDFSRAAVLCGLGEIGMHGAILTDEFGPFVRVCFVLTDAEIEPSEVKKPHLCDRCGECVRACPGHAISETGELDKWQCAVYYNGANGTKNPFMPPNAFADFEDRIEIISGEAKVTPEKARKILRNIYFYPPAQHAYQCSICGRACDKGCYMHLEQKGLLTKSFHTPFRTREEWRFSVKDFE